MAQTPLNARQKADLFEQLSRLERAGLPAMQAFGSLQLPAGLAVRAAAMRRLLEQGKSLADAGFRSGLFSDFEARLVRAACNAGSPAVTFQKLAHRYALQARLASQIRSRMAKPLLMLLIALAVQPLPALVSGSIGTFAYVLSVLRPFVFLAVLVGLYRFVKGRLFAITDTPTPLHQALTRILIATPVLGSIAEHSSVRDFVENLGILLEAGVPMLDALPQAVDTIKLCTLRQQFGRLHVLVTRGATLSVALNELQFRAGDDLRGFVHTGETSGSVPEMLLHFAGGLSESLTRSQTMLADWLPRLLYAAVALWMAYQILKA